MSKWHTGGLYSFANNAITLATFTYDEDGIGTWVQADVGRTVIFQNNDAGAKTFWGIVARVSGTTAYLFTFGHLPTLDQTLTRVEVLSNAEAHLFADYITKIKTLIKDSPAKLSDTDIAAMLSSAVTDYGEDQPLWISKSITGSGASSYNLATTLGALWKFGTTVIKEVEYPGGDSPPNILPNSEWEIYDDGSAQDGSNIVLRFPNEAPATTETFVIRLRLIPSLPDVGSPNFPDTQSNFNNICLLASAYCCWALAASYATARSVAIVGDAINYGDFTERYLKLGKEFLKRYNQTVFGDEEPTNSITSADAPIELESRASDRGRLLFH